VFDTLLAPTYLAAALVGHTRLVDSRYGPACCISGKPMRMRTSKLAVLSTLVKQRSSAQPHS